MGMTIETISALFSGRLGLNDSQAMPESIQWMPPGKHSITAHNAKGEPISLDVNVNEESAATAISSFKQIFDDYKANKGARPFIDLNHNDAEASGFVNEVFWAGEDPVMGGIRLKVEWTKAGIEAIQGKTFRQFSPTFSFNGKRFLANSVNMGGLVNRPAFREIQPFFAKDAQQGGDAKFSILQAAARMESKAFTSWLKDKKGMKDKDIEAMDDDVTSKLYAEYQEGGDVDAAAADSEGDTLNPDDNPILNEFVDWLENEKGFTQAVFEKLTNDDVIMSLFGEFLENRGDEEGEESAQASEVSARKAMKAKTPARSKFIEQVAGMSPMVESLKKVKPKVGKAKAAPACKADDGEKDYRIKTPGNSGAARGSELPPVDNLQAGMSKQLITALHAVSLVSSPDLGEEKAVAEIRAGGPIFKVNEQKLLAEIEKLTAQVEEGKAVVAKLYVKQAVSEGRISARDENSQAYWQKVIANDFDASEQLNVLPKRFDEVSKQMTRASSPFASASEKLVGSSGLGTEFQAVVLQIQATEKISPEAALVKAAQSRPDLYQAYVDSNKK